MALKRIYCASCGLEILPDENLKVETKTDPQLGTHTETYHGEPFICYPYRDMAWF